ncbi:hypothetical protein ACODUO_03090 [Stenotrophomonas maltophilia]
MAGDWIKFDVTTPDKPEVVKMAAVLGVDQDAVVGKLLRVWVWADQNSITSNGGCNGVTVTSAFLDRLTFCPGFTEAMRSVGWLVGEDGNLSLPNFERHNGKTAKERAVTNRRVAKSRSGKGSSNGDGVTDVTVTPLQEPLPEKRERREEAITPDTSLQASEIPEGFSATGWASVLMRRAGCHTASASHPDLIAAVEVEGVPFQMLVDLVEEGRARAPPPKSLFIWAVAAARGRHAEGAKPVNLSNGSNHGTRRLSPAERTAQLALEGELADAATFASAGHGYADALGADG